MLRKFKNKGQSSIEYATLFVVVVGALLATQTYMKRGIQGRWKATVDDYGDQYDPRTTISDVTHTLRSVTNTAIVTIPDVGGYWTERTDDTRSTETKSGTVTVGAY